MYDYQHDHTYTAQVADGIEDLALAELQELGATDCVRGFRFVHFKATPQILYRIVYRSRLASRILAPLVRFACPSDQALYDAAREVRWSDFLNPNRGLFSNQSKVSRRATTSPTIIRAGGLIPSSSTDAWPRFQDPGPDDATRRFANGSRDYCRGCPN